jgi:hypothetical protein
MKRHEVQTNQKTADRIRDALERRPFLCFFLLAFAMNLIIESMARLSPLGGAAYLAERPVQFLLSTAVLFACFALSLLFRRRLFVLTVTVSLWLILGITNAVLVALRVSPLSGIDFSILRSCLPIVKVYLRAWHVVLIALFLGLIVWLAARLFKRSGFSAVRFGREVLLCFSALAVTGGCLFFSVHTGAVETSFSDLPGAYEQYGFVTCFSLTVLNRGIREPEDYSEETVRTLLTSLEDREPSIQETEDIPVEEPSAAVSGEKPNLVIVQLESFMDPGRIAGTSYSEPPVPFFASLREKNTSGFLRVNTVGAGTANTEFEVLTGIDLGYFGAGEYPYQTVLEEEGTVAESMASDLKAAGYAAHAVHNHSGSFYDRWKVYEALGFDDFTPLEYMNGVEVNALGWAKDAILTDYIRACLDSSEGPDFVFAVSVQGHGLYPDALDDPDGADEREDPREDCVRVLTFPDGWTPEECAQLSYYAEQMREMDDFLKELCSMLEESAEESGEETLLLLYGDHLPPLPFDRGDGSGKGEPAFRDGSDCLDSEYIFMRIGGKRKPAEDRDLEAWEAGMAMLREAGAAEGLLNRCHRILEEPDELDGALRLLAYDMLYGERYAWNGETPFPRGTLRMGVREIRADSAVLSEGADGDILLTVRGENFTPYSVVAVNGRARPTEFVSPDELRADVSLFTLNPEFFDDASVSVLQRTADFTVLGGSGSVSLETGTVLAGERTGRRTEKLGPG